ncbi:hypothetical protein ACFWIA_34935 [Streptomyces sp. NPDC127068]|uniref:hypothetical protein n=1 Tax=Streptomyces sp. NPDC127068 TaxID=3347127 RepID=UPI00364B9851
MDPHHSPERAGRTVIVGAAYRLPGDASSLAAKQAVALSGPARTEDGRGHVLPLARPVILLSAKSSADTTPDRRLDTAGCLAIDDRDQWAPLPGVDSSVASTMSST